MIRILKTSMQLTLGIILFASFSVIGSMLCTSRYTYVLKIRAPEHAQELHGWRMLYKGDIAIPQGNLVKFTEKQCVFSFALVITPEVHCLRNTTLSSLRHIALESHEAVRYFELNLVFTKGAWSWEINELTRDQIPTILPPHAIIFLYDPALVASLEAPYKTVYSLDTAHEGGHCNFEMPTIVLRGNHESLTNALIYSQHALTKVWAYHRVSSCMMQIIDGIHCVVNAT